MFYVAMLMFIVAMAMSTVSMVMRSVVIVVIFVVTIVIFIVVTLGLALIMLMSNLGFLVSNFRSKRNARSVNVTGYRYIAHLYCLAVQAGFYSDVVECSLSTRENLVRSPSGKKEFFFACYIWRPT